MSNGPVQTIEPGHTNRHAQRVLRAAAPSGSDQRQTRYVIECEQCQHRYAANESDIAQRRCPNCQSGKPGLPLGTDDLRRDR